jgi:hypothetical protein
MKSTVGQSMITGMRKNTDMSRDKEYLEKLIELLESDKKAVMIYIALELAIPLLTIKDIAIGQSILVSSDPKILIVKVILVASLFLFLVAALFHFLYWRRIHLNEFAVAKYLLNGTGEDARTLIFDEKSGIWAKHGWKYILAHIAFIAGVIGYLSFFISAIF